MEDTSRSFPFIDLYHNTTTSNRSKIIQGVRLAKWKKNENAPRCGICIKSFGFLRRKHHCRVCGDVCCRRCLGFCVVDVPYVGVDISYTCLRCIRHHNKKPTLVEDLASLAQSFDNAQLNHERSRSNRPRSKTSEGPFVPSSPVMSNSEYSNYSNASTPRSLDSALTPCESPDVWETEYQVIVSQYHNQKLHSVCSLLGDYLECKGGAIALMQDTHVWVLAHRGLRPTALHSSTFLSICHQAMQSKESFTASRDRKPESSTRSPSATSTIKSSRHQPFRFFGVSPIFHKEKSYTPIGCIIALDTKPRDDPTAKRVQKTLDNLSRLVMNLLGDEEKILRLFESGDFKVFASSHEPSNGVFGVVSPASSFSSPQVSSAPTTPQKTRSDDTSFFARYANPDVVSTASDQPQDPLRKHAQSNPEPKQPYSTLSPPSTLTSQHPRDHGSFRQAA